MYSLRSYFALFGLWIGLISSCNAWARIDLVQSDGEYTVTYHLPDVDLSGHDLAERDLNLFPRALMDGIAADRLTARQWREKFNLKLSQIRFSVSRGGSDPFELKALPIYYLVLFLSDVEPSWGEDRIRRQWGGLAVTLQNILSLLKEERAEDGKDSSFTFSELKGELLKRVNETPVVSKQGRMAITSAAARGCVDSLRLLMKTTLAELDFPQQINPLFIAIDRKQIGTTLLLTQSRWMDSISSGGENPLHLACWETDQPQLAQIIYDAKPSLANHSHGSVTPLLVALRRENREAVQYLVRKSPDLLRARDDQGRTAFHDLVARDYFDLVRELFRPGTPAYAERNDRRRSLLWQKSDDGSLPVHRSVILSDRDDVSLLLLELAPETRLEKFSGFNIIHAAARKGTLSVIKKALSYGATNLKSKAPGQPTFLHFAVRGDHADIVRFLVMRDRTLADEMAIDQPAEILEQALFRSEYTPFEYAIGLDRAESLKAFLSVGVKPNQVLSPRRLRWTPLHLAAAMDSPESLRILLEAGADPDFSDAAGRKPEDVPGQTEATKIVFAEWREAQRLRKAAQEVAELETRAAAEQKRKERSEAKVLHRENSRKPLEPAVGVVAGGGGGGSASSARGVSPLLEEVIRFDQENVRARTSFALGGVAEGSYLRSESPAKIDVRLIAQSLMDSGEDPALEMNLELLIHWASLSPADHRSLLKVFNPGFVRVWRELGNLPDEYYVQALKALLANREIEAVRRLVGQLKPIVEKHRGNPNEVGAVTFVATYILASDHSDFKELQKPLLDELRTIESRSSVGGGGGSGSAEGGAGATGVAGVAGGGADSAPSSEEATAAAARASSPIHSELMDAHREELARALEDSSFRKFMQRVLIPHKEEARAEFRNFDDLKVQLMTQVQKLPTRFRVRDGESGGGYVLVDRFAAPLGLAKRSVGTHKVHDKTYEIDWNSMADLRTFFEQAGITLELLDSMD